MSHCAIDSMQSKHEKYVIINENSDLKQFSIIHVIIFFSVLYHYLKKSSESQNTLI